MENKLTSFLIQCDSKGKILNIYWYEPIYLISPYQKNIKDIFCEKDKFIIENMINKSFFESNKFLCENSLTLASLEDELATCFMSMGDTVLIHGNSIKGLDLESSLPILKNISYRFMKIIQSSNNTLITENEILIKSQFEQIQKLNNDLINTQRQLKISNAKLNRVNKDLNNRLVKDPLTGLLSRYQYRDEIELTIRNLPNKLGIFIFIDIDNFKQINDSYGHKAGDTYLKIFANRLQSLSFENLICMRISGDEFGVYIHGYEEVGQKEIYKIWTEIKEKVVGSPIEIDSVNLGIFCSLGMSVYGEDTTEIYELIEFADFAMYEVKKSGKNSYKKFDINTYKLIKKDS